MCYVFVTKRTKYEMYNTLKLFSGIECVVIGGMEYSSLFPPPSKYVLVFQINFSSKAEFVYDDTFYRPVDSWLCIMSN